MKLPTSLIVILDKILCEGGNPNIVGGAVRDSLMGIEPKDYDVEVFNMSKSKLESVLALFGDVDAVGASFGVYKVGNYDFSLPRRENKSGEGHRGFIPEFSDLTFAEAAARRDYTINSVAWNFAERKLIDDWGGADDIRSKVLRPTSVAFKEDALRILRGMQFAGRFDMDCSEWVADYAMEMIGEYANLAKERIWEEWKKWALKSKKPSAGLWFLNKVHWIELYPELDALRACPQDPIWHPEGDAWVHTCHVVDAAVEICDRYDMSDDIRLVVVFAALLHDVGKPETTVLNDEGRWSSPSHDKVGMPIAERFLLSIGCPQDIIDRVKPLVGEHMVHVGLEDVTLRVVNRLANRLGKATINELMLVIEADMNGRPPLEGGLPDICGDMLRMAAELDIVNNQPKPILMGRHLIEMGYKPGPLFGEILAQVYQEQLDGDINTLDEAMIAVTDYCMCKLIFK